MATINSREAVDSLIENDGIYPGDEDFPVVKIVQYDTAFGGTAYGLIYKGDPLNMYAESPFVQNPKTLWEVGKKERTDPPSMDTIQMWMMEDGGCEATDGCWVEPDGRCEHGKPSWMLQMGLI